MLTAQWTHRLPLIQRVPPAELAASLIHDILDDVDDIKVIDFCSGAGGPIPVIEKSVNATRASHNLHPIPFRLSDLHPNIDAWMEHSSRSANLSFIPQAVDATAAPVTAISRTASGAASGAPSSGQQTCHVFCLAFHHFDDAAALRVLRSSLATSDALALVELQDRSLGMLLLMALEPALVLLLTAFWFADDWLHLAATYLVPVLPFVLAWDGLVSCLRTRTFAEVLVLAEQALGEKATVGPVERAADGRRERTTAVALCGDWKFTSVRELHTWPFGYMNAVVGQKRSM
ncbi:hypothetical protein MBLNU459_g0883t1 [Dothideomycetes sp. NU459]